MLPFLLPRPLARVWRPVRAQLPPLNFISIHWAYFIFTPLISAIIFWAASGPDHSVRFIDALFLTVSAMTLAGLNTVNLSTLNIFQQVCLFVLTMLGSAIFVSAFVVHFRRKVFEARFKDMISEMKQQRRLSRATSVSSIPALERARTDSRPPGRSAARTRPTRSDTQLREKAQPDYPNSLPTRMQSDADFQEKAQAGQPPSDISSKPSDLSENNKTSEPSSDGRSRGSDAFLSATGHSRTIAFSPDARNDGNSSSAKVRPRRSSFLAARGIGAHPGARLQTRGAYEPGADAVSTTSRDTHPVEDQDAFHRIKSYLVGRNSQFHGLSEAEREHLGGVEYRALYVLSLLVPAYFILWQLLTCISLGAWMAYNRASMCYENGSNPWWVGAFNAVSAFNNNGMSLLDANMTVLNDAYYVLITMGLLILAGNTCYPIFLRLIIWTIWKLLPDHPRWSELRDTLRFLLDHPRRCYTNLFPARHTWWLLSAVIILNGIDWMFFEILNIGNSQLSLPTNLRVIDGLFQAIAVRSGGFYVVPIANIRIAVQVLYVVMMYISVYPVSITIRNSNIYEERSLGIYSSADDPPNADPSTARPSIWTRLTGLHRQLTGFEESRSYFVRQQIRAQLAHDIWWLVLAIFLIMIIEGSRFQDDPVTFSVFNVIFETVSAYGTVGISVGVPYADYSFCGAWQTLSKLILCGVMLRGRQRGLPVAIDKAILLPGDKLGQAEEEDAIIRRRRSMSYTRQDPPQETTGLT